MTGKTNLKNKLVFTEHQLMVVAIIHAIGLTTIFILPLAFIPALFLIPWIIVCMMFFVMVVGPDWVFGCFFPLNTHLVHQLTELASRDRDVADYLARVYSRRETLFGLDLSRCEAAIKKKARRLP